MKFKPTNKYKMNQEEIQMHLHLKRKGASTTKNGKAYNRKEKHKAIFA